MFNFLNMMFVFLDCWQYFLIYGAIKKDLTVKTDFNKIKSEFWNKFSSLCSFKGVVHF